VSGGFGTKLEERDAKEKCLGFQNSRHQLGATFFGIRTTPAEEEEERERNDDDEIPRDVYEQLRVLDER
jgi:hypothetical protein